MDPKMLKKSPASSIFIIYVNDQNSHWNRCNFTNFHYKKFLFLINFHNINGFSCNFWYGMLQVINEFNKTRNCCKLLHVAVGILVIWAKNAANWRSHYWAIESFSFKLATLPGAFSIRLSVHLTLTVYPSICVSVHLSLHPYTHDRFDHWYVMLKF